jgi:methylase of polypeptide subunit release factors
MNGKREYGDYQTPEFFSLAVCQYLQKQRKVKPSVIIEPTCGVGSFVKSSLIFDASEIIGVEVNPEYCEICKQEISDPRVQIINADFFSFDLKSVIKGKEQFLIIGNPPWVNNSTLSTLNSDNLPTKANFKGLKGIDALTGASNFDICEYIILQLIASLPNTNTTVAMLCKTSVARNSMFKSPIVNNFKKQVIVTQKKVRENTAHIENDAPKTWSYLESHKERFLKRKSSIYKDAPDYSMFGIGDYSYAQYKVGVSGFYKKPLFSVLISNDGKPVMTDDTSYFICFSTYDAAYTAMLILNSEKVQQFLLTIAFLDAKRPFTKKVLERIDFHKILGAISASDLVDTEKQLGLHRYFDETMLANFKLLPELSQES